MPTILAPAIPGNDWEPIDWTARPPEDQTYHVSDEAVLNAATAVYAVVQSRSDGKVWDRSTLVTPTSGDWTSYAIPGQDYAARSFRIVVPFSVMPERQYLVRVYKRSGDAPVPTDRVLQTFKANSFTNGSPNPAGVVVDCDFGQVNAMRVTDPNGRPLEGVDVKATATFPGGVVERGSAKTDKEGRWKLNLVCEPNRPHTITFTFDGYEAVSVEITPGGSV